MPFFLLFFRLFLISMPASAAPGIDRPDRDYPVVSSVLPGGMRETAAVDGRPVRLVSGVFRPAGSLAANLERVRAGAGGQGVRVILQVEPGRETALRAAGVRLVQYLPEGSWFAVVPAGLDAGALSRLGVIWVGAIYPEDKSRPEMVAGEVGGWAMGDGGRVRLRVRVFEEEDLAELGAWVGVLGGEVRAVDPRLRLSEVELPLEQTATLRELGAVRWVEEGLPPRHPHNDRARLNAGGEEMGLPPYGLTGAGVPLGIWDESYVDPGHIDFAGRLVIADTGPLNTVHPTHVAGTMAGSGEGSINSGGTNRQWRGMAPGATIVSYEFNSAVPEHESAIQQHGIVLAQNSWGFFISEQIGTCGLYGQYSSEAPENDQIVTGLFGRPISVVFSAGNYRNGLVPNGCKAGPHRTLGPPGTAKNVITVGAIESDTSAMVWFSSWGPVADGRVKPEVVAPGSQASGDFGTTSTRPGNNYGALVGTSMAAPVVSGGIGLLVEDYRNRNSGQNPRPSLVRALVVHAARDLVDGSGYLNVGPDYASGYGRFRIREAVDQLRARGYRMGEVRAGETNRYVLEVPEGAAEVKITLAWDDPAGAENAAVALVNNLDLVVRTPLGERKYPWTLDPANPAAPAVRTREDALNVIEQVQATAVAGSWEVEVVGRSVPVSAPQRYALVFTPVGMPSVPILKVAQALAQDSLPGLADGNGFPEPGEVLAETVVLSGSDGPPLTHVTGRVRALTPGVTVLSGESEFPALASNGTTTNGVPFTYRLAKDLSCGTRLQFELVTSGDGVDFTNHFEHVVGQPAVTNVATHTFAAPVPNPGVGVPVPDNGVVTLTNAVGTAGRVRDVNVWVRLDHTWVGDLELSVESPDGTRVALLPPTGNSGVNLGVGDCGTVGWVPTRFDDAATGLVTSGTAPFAGVFRPTASLAAFNGRLMQGDWKLRVADVAVEDTGRVLCWGLDVEYQQEGYVCGQFNQVPVAASGSVEVIHGGSVGVELRGTDGDADPLSFEITQLPGAGTLESFDAATGRVTYVAAAGFQGRDAFRFRVFDGYAYSAEAEVAVEVLPARAELSLAAWTDGVLVPAGSEFRYWVAVTNAGPNVASEVLVSTVLAPGVTWVSGGPGVDCVAGTGVVECRGPALAVGEGRVWEMVARADSPGWVTNRISVVAAELDMDPGDNVAEVVRRVRESTDVGLVLGHGPDPVLLGGRVAYGVVVTNAGPAVATGVVVEEQLAAGLAVVEAVSSQGTVRVEQGRVVAELGDLAVGAEARVTVEAAAGAVGVWTNVVTVFSEEIELAEVDNRAEAVTSVLPAVDLGLAGSVAPEVGLWGQRLDFGVVVTNAGPSVATGVVVEEELPAGVQVEGVSVSEGQAAVESGRVVWRLGSLGAGGAATASVRVVLNEVGWLTNRVHVTGVEAEIGESDNTLDLAVEVKPAVDLGVNQTMHVSEVLIGGEVEVVLGVTNRGPSEATGVEVRGEVPPGLNLESVSVGSGSARMEGNAFVWELGRLDAGGAGGGILVLRGAALGSWTNVVGVSAAEAEVFAGDNRSEAVVVVREGVDLALQVTGEAGPVLVGREVEYEVGVTHVGGASPGSVRLTGRLAQGMKAVAVQVTQGTGVVVEDGSRVVCEFGSMGTGEVVTARIRAVSTLTGSLTNRFEVTSDLIEEDPADNVAAFVTETVPSVDLSVVNGVSESGVALGREFEQVWRVRNAGPSLASSVVLTNEVGAGATVVSVASGSGGCVVEGAVVRCALGDLPAGAEAEVRLVMRAEELGMVTNRASVGGAVDELEVGNNVAEGVWWVRPGVDLALAWEGPGGGVPLGGRVTYGVVVTNQGANAASVAVLDARIGAGLTVVEALASQGSVRVEGDRVLAELGDLAVGGEARLTLELSAVASGAWTNQVEVVSDDIELTAIDNRAERVTAVVPAVDLALDAAFEPPSGLLGQPMQLTLVVTNRGPSPATGVWVDHRFAEGLVLRLASLEVSQGDGTVTEEGGGRLVWQVGDLGIGGGAVARLNVEAAAVGWFTNTGSVVGTEFETSVSDNAVVRGVEVRPAVDLTLRQVSDAREILPGGVASLEVTVTNRGPSSATGVAVRGELPAGLSVVGWEPGQGDARVEGGAVVWEVGQLGAGAGLSRVLVLRGEELGVWTNAMQVTSVEAEVEGRDNAFGLAVAVKEGTDLVVGVAGEPGPVLVGQEVIYDVGVTNVGAVEAKGVRLDGGMAAGLSVIEVLVSQGTGSVVSGGVGVLCQFGAVGPGSVVTARVRALAQGTGILTNRFGVVSELIELVQADNLAGAVTEVVPFADLLVVQEASASPVLVNDRLRLTLHVVNNALYAIGDGVVENSLPGGVDVLSTAVTQGAMDSQGGVLVWETGVLGAGDVATATVVMVPRVLGVLTNVVVLGSEFADPANPNLRSSLVVPVVETPTLALSVEGSKMVLSWPLVASGFTLEVTDSLSPPVTWSEERNAQVIVQDRVTVTIKTSGGPRFYRLRKLAGP